MKSEFQDQGQLDQYGTVVFSKESQPDCDFFSEEDKPDSKQIKDLATEGSITRN